MYKILFDSIVVDEADIVGFDSIVIKKVLSPTYFGYWNQDGFGFSESDLNSKITVNNEELVNYIKGKFKIKLTINFLFL